MSHDSNKRSNKSSIEDGGSSDPNKRNRTKNISMQEAEVVLAAMVESERGFDHGYVGPRFRPETWSYALEKWNTYREVKLREPPRNLKAIKKFYSNVCAQVALCREALEGSPYENEEEPSEECKVYFLTTLKKAEHTFTKFVLYSKYLKLLGEKRPKEAEEDGPFTSQAFNANYNQEPNSSYSHNNGNNDGFADSNNKKDSQDDDSLQDSISVTVEQYQPVQHQTQQFSQTQRSQHQHNQYPVSRQVNNNLVPAMAPTHIVAPTKSSSSVAPIIRPINSHHVSGLPGDEANTGQNNGVTINNDNNTGSDSVLIPTSSNSNSSNGNVNRMSLSRQTTSSYQRPSSNSVQIDRSIDSGNGHMNISQQMMLPPNDITNVNPNSTRKAGNQVSDKTNQNTGLKVSKQQNYDINVDLIGGFSETASKRQHSSAFGSESSSSKKAFADTELSSSNVLEKVSSLKIPHSDKKGFIRYLLHNALAFNLLDKARTVDSMMLLYEVYCDERNEKAVNWN